MAPHSGTLAWKIPWTEEPGRLQSMGSLSQTRLRDFTFIFHFHALEKEMATHSSTLAWKIPWTEEPGRLQSMESLKSWARLSDFTFTFHFHALEKEMAPYSSVLAWRIPGTGEPGGLPSMGFTQSRTRPKQLSSSSVYMSILLSQFVSPSSHSVSTCLFSTSANSCPANYF